MKIGFIDYYLDEWHANSYPEFIRKATDGEVEVAYAYAMIDSPRGGMTTAEWCKKYEITRCESIEQLIELSDAIVVLSPDNCEMHEQLCQLPLRSGKPVYVDKTFAPDAATAQRLFAIAQEHDTPCYSTSALRYATEYKEVDIDTVRAVNLWGSGNYEIYSIHLIEPLMMLIKSPAKRVMYLPGERWLAMVVEFEDGRTGTISLFEDGSPYITNVCCTGGNKLLNIKSSFFDEFILELVDFFKNETEKVSHEETIDILTVREAGNRAQKTPGEWVMV